MAQGGARMAKWWEPTYVDMPVCPDLLWTSTNKPANFYSPGQLVVVCIASPAQPGAVTIMLDWDITVSIPSVELLAEEEEPVFTMIRDARLSWYPANANYGVLVQPFAVPQFDPSVHEVFPAIEMEAWGLGEINIGDYVVSSAPLQFTGKFHVSGDETTISTSIWYCGMYSIDGTTTTYKTLTPIIRFLKQDGTGYDIEFAAYTNSTGSGNFTWADIYGGLVSLHAGTTFKKIDPQAHYVLEELTIFKMGKKTRINTGRTVKIVGPLPKEQRALLVPMVQISTSAGETVNPPLPVTIVNADPVPVSIAQPVGVTGTVSIAGQVNTIVSNTSSQAVPVQQTGDFEVNLHAVNPAVNFPVVNSTGTYINTNIDGLNPSILVPVDLKKSEATVAVSVGSLPPVTGTIPVNIADYTSTNPVQTYFNGATPGAVMPCGITIIEPGVTMPVLVNGQTQGTQLTVNIPGTVTTSVAGGNLDVNVATVADGIVFDIPPPPGAAYVDDRGLNRAGKSYTSYKTFRSDASNQSVFYDAALTSGFGGSITSLASGAAAGDYDVHYQQYAMGADNKALVHQE
jgi:hypothetical protein